MDALPLKTLRRRRFSLVLAVLVLLVLKSVAGAAHVGMPMAGDGPQDPADIASILESSQHCAVLENGGSGGIPEDCTCCDCCVSSVGSFALPADHDFPHPAGNRYRHALAPAAVADIGPFRLRPWSRAPPKV